MTRKMNKRPTVSYPLKTFTFTSDENAFIEVTEWTNGEGFDININDGAETKIVSLHIDELEAINHLVGVLKYDFKEEEL